MSGALRLVLLGTAALFVCSAQTYVVNVGQPSQPELYTGTLPEGSVTTAAGEWDVTVAFDPAQCRVYCAYRHRRDSLGHGPLAGLLPPPAVTIQVPGYRTVTVDPQGLRFPGLTSALLRTYNSLFLPGRRLASGVFVRVGLCRRADKAPSEVLAQTLTPIHAVAAPRRI